MFSYHAEDRHSGWKLGKDKLGRSGLENPRNQDGRKGREARLDFINLSI